jgi:hypothetical protein
MAESARSRAAAFDLGRAVRRIEDIYDRALGAAATSGAPPVTRQGVDR